MSYSRWGNSRWYTYHSAQSGEKKENQIFEVCGVGCFTYNQLKDDIDDCVRQCAEAEGDCKEYELTKLKSYMLSFMGDIEEEFNGQ